MGTAHRQEVTDVFYFDQLSEEAKETARDWWRERGNSDEWSDSVYEQAEEAGALLGIEISNKRDGRGADIAFSGFSSQGDGASWTGSYRYRKGSVKDIRKQYPVSRIDEDGNLIEYPRNKDLLDIAIALQQIQAPFFYKLEARVERSHRGGYVHSNMMDVSVAYDGNIYHDVGDAEDGIRDQLRLFADWIYDCLEAEDEWLNSDEQVDESIIAGQYEFDAEGNRV